MEITPVVIIGDRVKIQPMEDYHVQELFDAGNNPDIWAYMPMKVQSIEDMKYLVNGALQAREQGSEFPFVSWIRIRGKLWEALVFLIYPYQTVTWKLVGHGCLQLFGELE